MKEFPAAADWRVTAALVEACEKLGFRYHVGTGCTCASFYTGQCRTTVGGYRPSHIDGLFKDLQQAGVLSGYPDGTFRPQNAVTREEACKILCEGLLY